MLKKKCSERALLAIALALTLAVGAANGALRDRFASPWLGYDASVYPQGHTSWCMRMADFNNDGFMDLAVGSWYANSRLSVLLADGLGGYHAPVFYPLDLGALDLEVADFDGDGDFDIAVSSTGQYWEGATFQVWLNDGAGGFSALGHFNCGQGPTGMTVADFNGDGLADVAVAHDRYIVSGNSIAVMLANGSGGFDAPSIITLQAGTYKIDSGDVDGDGDVDLAVAHESNRVTVLANTNGQFAPTAVLPGLPSGAITEYPAVKIADIDRDGDLDLLYTHASSGGYYSGAVALFRNLQNEGFSAAERIDLPPGTEGAVEVDVTDIDGDTWPDILAAQPLSQSWSLVRGGSEGFSPAEMYRAGEFPVSIRAGDVDGDDSADIVLLGSDSMEACVYRNTAGGAFGQPPLIDMADPALAPISFSNLAVADIDHDGDLDLAVGYSANFASIYGLSVRRNNGAGAFGPRENYATSIFPIKVMLRDLTGDGYADLLWAEDDWPTRFRVRVNNGSGAFTTTITGPSIGSPITAVETGDVDNDGDLDVIVGGWYGEVAVSRNNGGSFAAFQMSQLDDGQATALAAGDFNEDGKLDLLTNSGVQGWAEIMLGNGNGAFQPAVTISTGRGVTALAAGHLDADGHLDFCASYGLDGTGLTARRGRGDGNFFAPLSYYGSYSAVDDTSFSLALRDVDGDGHTDALAGFMAAQEFDFWRGLGNGTFESKVRYGVGWRTFDLAYGDFDGDGVGDVAALCEGYGAGAWYYPGVAIISAVGGGSTPGDLDGDGDVDQSDLGILLADFGCVSPPAPSCPGDADGDGDTDQSDLGVLLANFQSP